MSVTESVETISEAFLREALSEADLNALRLALYHQTQDEELAEMKVSTFPVRGGAFEAKVLAKDHHADLIEKAIAYLSDPNRTIRPHPEKQEAERMMALFQDRELAQPELDFGFEDLGFDPLSRDRAWRRKPSDRVLEDFEVTIVGSGISGIAASIQLARLGIKHELIEKRVGHGGTWYINDYPNARVDISTFLYQYKFEANYPWKSVFATQAELLEYLDFIVDKYGVRERIRYETELQSAKWEEPSKQWALEIRTPDGRVQKKKTNAIISAVGLFGTPKLPNIEGIETYEGQIFHTTEWDHSVELEGKRIAVIGTGSTGTQLMPRLAETADHITVYQRTPSWITPVKNFKATVSKPMRWLLDNMPGYANWQTYSLHVAELQLQEFHELDQDWIKQGGQVSEKNDQLRKVLTEYIRSKTDSEEQFKKLLPNYAPVARRLVVDNGFYDALARDTVDLETDPIAAITPTGIRTRSGAEKDFDIIALSAGFHVSRYLWPVDYVGRDGETLETLWEPDGPRAHLGVNLPGFPNLFVIYGPNAQARAGSYHSWIEILIRYITGLITSMLEEGAQSIEVKRSAYDAYNQKMDEAMQSTLWEQEGQGGYYVNDQGRSGVNMPWRIYEFYEFVTNDSLEEFSLD